MRKHEVVAVAAIFALLVGGCSDSEGDDKPDAAPDYCATLEQARADFQGFNFLTLSDEDFDDLLSKIEALEQAASGETQQAWATLSTALNDLQSALAEANLSVTDLEALSRNEVPNGVDTAKLPQVTDSIRALSTDPAIQDASTTIQEDARTTCEITLGPSPGDTPAS